MRGHRRGYQGSPSHQRRKLLVSQFKNGVNAEDGATLADLELRSLYGWAKRLESLSGDMVGDYREPSQHAALHAVIATLLDAVFDIAETHGMSPDDFFDE